MPIISLESPTRARLPDAWVVDGSTATALRDALQYEDQRAVYEWQRLKEYQRQDDYISSRMGAGRRHWFVEKYGRDELDRQAEEAAKACSKSVLEISPTGWYIPAGLAPRIAEEFGGVIERRYQYPEYTEGSAKTWSQPGYAPRGYQVEAEQKLVACSHGAVELPTGSGKSYVIASLCNRFSDLGCIILAPTLSIAEQLLVDLTARFGKNAVGQFFAGKKESKGRRVVVAVSKSVTNLTENAPLYLDLAQRQVVIVDESHMIAADTLRAMMEGIFAQVPYRFFFSGTQIRGDGLDLVLEGITGPVVQKVAFKDLVNEGYLSKPTFHQFLFPAKDDWETNDVMKMTRHHIYQHQAIYAHAGDTVLKAVRKGWPVLVLIDEVAQFPFLLPHILGVKIGFAHGGISAKDVGEDARLRHLPKEFHKSKPMELVAAFDRGDLEVLVGTSCIGIGTDLKTPRMIIDLVGGKAEAALRQRVGRGSRLAPGKSEFHYVDYGVYTIPVLAKHVAFRAKVFKQIYSAPKVVKY